MIPHSKLECSPKSPLLPLSPEQKATKGERNVCSFSMPSTAPPKKKNYASSSPSPSKSGLPLVVVAGATGHIGSLVVKELIKSGKFRVRAIVRPKKQQEAKASTTFSTSSSSSSSTSAVAARLSRLGAEIWHGDVTDPPTIAGCCDGASAAVSALGVRSFDRKDGSVWSVDRDGTLAFFDQARSAAAAASSSSTLSAAAVPSSSSSSSSAATSSSPPPPALRVFVMVATFEGKDSRRAESISEAKEEAVDEVVAAAKAEAAKAASAAAVSGGEETSTLKVRILRPTAFFRDMSSWLLEPLLSGNKKDVVLTGDGGTKINPVDGRDVAKLVRDEIEAASSASSSYSSSSNVELVREIPVGGPQVFTLRSMAALAAEVAASKLRAAAASSKAAAEAAAAAAAHGSSSAAAAAAAPSSSSSAPAGAATDPPSSSSTAPAAALHRTSPKPQELPAQIVIRSRPLWPLKILAPLAALFAPCWGAAAALSDGARFVLYSATHDAVTDQPYGSWTLRRYFEERADAVLQAAEEERAKGVRRRRARAATTTASDGEEGEEGGGGAAAAGTRADGAAAAPAPVTTAAAAAP